MLEELFPAGYLLFGLLLLFALTLLGHCGFVTPESLRQQRRCAVVAIFAIAAVLTPPDPISQFNLSLLLVAVYEASIRLLDQT